MLETEWLASEDPRAMLPLLRGVGTDATRLNSPAVSDRKLRLFACEWYARAFPATHEVHPVIDAVRDWADGKLSRDEAMAVPGTGRGSRAQWFLFRELPECLHEIGGLRLHPPHTKADIAALLRCIVGNPYRPVTVNPEWITPAARMLAQSAYDSSKHGDGSLDPLTLMALADALEEAGCVGERCQTCEGRGSDRKFMRAVGWWRGKTTPCPVTTECPTCEGRCVMPSLLLAHLRESGPHYRGCWAVDLINNKS